MANGRGIHTPTLCWDCQKANALGCRWHNGSWKPVEGWDAERSLHVDKLTGKIFDTYLVKSCPLFEPDEENEIPDEPEENREKKARTVRIFYVFKRRPKEAPVFARTIAENGEDVLIGAAEAAREIERVRTKEKKLDFEKIVGRLEYASAQHSGPVRICGAWIWCARYIEGVLVQPQSKRGKSRSRAKRVKCLETGKVFKSYLEAGRWLETQRPEQLAKKATSYFSYASGRYGKQPFKWRGYTWKLLD